MRKPQTPLSGRTILVVDDQDETLNSIRKLLEREGHRVLTADRGAKALALLGQHDVHVMLIDYFMPVMNGELLIRAIRNRNTTVQIILQTGYAGEKPPRDMMRRLAIQGYHDKCDGPERLLLWVDASLKNYDQVRRLEDGATLAAGPGPSVMRELRWRLNAMVADVGLARGGTLGPVSAETASVLDDVLGTGAPLLELMEHEVDPAALRACPSSMRLEPVDVAAFVREAIETAPWRLDLDLPDDPLVATVDRAKLRIIVRSLVADVGTRAGDGTIDVSAVAGQEGSVVLCVGCTGGGMAPTHDAAVFDVTRPVPAQASPGVAVARCLARAMGGDVTLESDADGTVFTLVLPGGVRPIATATAGANEGAC